MKKLLPIALFAAAATISPGASAYYISMVETLNYARRAGLGCDNSLVIAGAVAMAESGLNTEAVGVNTDGSRDRGLWQINSRWHPEVSDACAFDPACNASAMAAISSGGADWTPWSTYNSGRYMSFIGEAQAAYGSSLCGCDCSPGATQAQACGDCGAQSRTCGGDCHWGGWGACAGPDPDGGNRACDTGELGVCKEGRVRCVGGWLACRRLVEPAAELCDTLDNDCDGAANEESPARMGEPRPAWAARLADFSVPASVGAGEAGEAWVSFVNEGTMTWGKGEILLGSLAAREGAPSELFVEGSWPSWDVAAALPEEVAPGGTGILLFSVRGPPGRRGELVEEAFALLDPAGEPMPCPAPAVTLALLVGSPQGDAESEGEVEGDLASQVYLERGCGCAVAR